MENIKQEKKGHFHRLLLGGSTHYRTNGYMDLLLFWRFNTPSCLLGPYLYDTAMTAEPRKHGHDGGAKETKEEGGGGGGAANRMCLLFGPKFRNTAGDPCFLFAYFHQICHNSISKLENCHVYFIVILARNCVVGTPISTGCHFNCLNNM